MSTRKIIDVKQNGEKVWPKGHAQAIYMSDGRTVEDAINAGGGGGGGITVETDPIFSASPAATITNEKMAEWDGKQDAITDLDTIREGASKGATAVQPSALGDYAKSSSLAKVATSGSYTDLSDKPTIPSAVTESTVSGWGFTKNTGTYSKPSGGIPKSDLASDVQASLSNADNAVQKGMVGTLNIINVEGVYDDDYVYALPTAAAKNVDEDYDDIILSRGSVKTINGESIFGSGDIPISGGSGEVGPQGPQGDKGDKGDTGVGVQSVAQTTTSNTDGGSNIVTVTLTDGTKSTFTVKNGSKGSQGVQGEQGPKGDKGDTGANGTNGTNGVSVSSIKQTTTSTADGGTNVVTVTLSNGTTSTFNVKNGSKGSNGTNGTNGKDGADGADGATFTPSVDSAGNLSWTNNKGLANPPTVNIKGPKGDAGEGGGSSGGKEVVLISNGVIELLERDKIYIVEDSTGSRTFEIQSIEEYFFGSGSYAEYVVIFASEDDMGSGKPLSIILPDNVYWANGQIPDLTLNANYELSIVGWEASNNSGFNAVITPFKPV